MPDSIQIIPQPAQTDPVGKYRVSTPQSLIDTDFEYGQQSVKWEQLDLENNRQSCYYMTNNALPVTAMSSGGTTSLVITCATTVAVGTPVFINECLDPNGNGWWLVTASTAGTSFTVTTTNATATGALWNATNTYVYAGFFYTNAGIAVTANSTTSIVTSASAITVNTVSPHGLAAGSYVYIVNTTGGTNVNGAWVVATVPTANQFTIATTTASGTVTTPTTTTQNCVYARPSGYVEARAYNGSINFTAGAAVPSQQMLRQTRRYFRYQSGKGIQFSTGTILKPRLLTSSITSSGYLVTVTTRSPHNLTANAQIQVAGATVAAYNGIFNINSILGPNSFTYLTANQVVPSSSPAVASNGTVPSVSPYTWYGSSNKIGFFDSQNGMFFQYDGTTLYAVYRNSINQLGGTVAVTQGSAAVTGTGTYFTSQLNPGDYIVIRGQSYRVTSIASDTSLYINPEYRGATIANALVSKTIDLKIPQTQWNDPCNGTGPSGYNIDLTKMQMFYIDYSWYGAGAIRWGVRTTNGTINYVYSLANNNVNYNAYLRSGNLPSRYESNGQSPVAVLYSSITNSQNTIPVVSAAGFNPNGGTIKITAPGIGGAIEYVTYTGIIFNSTSGVGYDQFTGITRGTTGGGAASAFTAAYPASNSVPPVSLEYVAPDTVAVLSHWGSSIVMDGGFNNDFSLIFNYGTTANLAVATGTSVPLLAIRLAPSVDNGTVGTLGNKEVINRMTIQLKELGILSSQSVLVQLNLNGVTTGFNGNFVSPTQSNTYTSSICQVASNSNTTCSVTAGESIGAAYTSSTVVSGNQSTLDLSSIAGIGNCILGGGLTNNVPNGQAGTYPDGPDILYVVINNNSGATANVVARLSWQESQA